MFSNLGCLHALLFIAPIFTMHTLESKSNSQPWKVIFLLSVSFVATLDTTVCSLTEVCPVSFPNGTTVCARDTPSQVTTSVTRTECAVECLVTSSGVQCAAFNYNSTSQNCDVYNSLPNSYATSSDCINYQQPGQAYQGFATVKNVATNCSFPYTYNRRLYYQCVQTVSDSANLCNKFACLTSNWTLAACPPPTNYSVQNVTISFPVNLCSVTVVILTFSVPCSGVLPPTVITVTTTSVNNWMVIHQNLNSSFSWNRPWASYKSGFGSSSSDYWMGLAVLSQMTATQNYRLRIEMFDPTNGWYSIEYSSFKIDPEQNTLFALHLPSSGGTGDVTDAFLQHNGQQFTTTDQNNGPGTNCASTNGGGGWWYNNCGGAFLTAKNMKWASTQFPGGYLQLQTSRMLLKAV